MHHLSTASDLGNDLTWPQAAVVIAVIAAVVFCFYIFWRD